MSGIIDIVNRANQRGGRMLSVLDLLDAGTLSPELAAWLLARIAEGSSWLVGARPGGAGKTTIMCALLAMLPEGSPVHLAGDGDGWGKARSGECVVAYEIGAGSYEGYVWGGELQTFASLGERGCRIVSNLHADTLEQARGQIVGQNGVSEAGFGRFGLFLPIRRGSSGGRSMPVVPEVWRCAAGAWERVRDPDLGVEEQAVLGWIVKALGEPERTVEGVRAAWNRFILRVS